MMSKCGKDISEKFAYGSSTSSIFCSYHILTSPVLYERKANCEMESTKAQAELLNA